MATYINRANFNGSNGSHFFLDIYYDLLSQSVANNTSTVRVYAYIGSVDGWSAGGSSADVYIEGHWVGSISGIAARSNTLVGSYDKTVSHSGDGTGSFSTSASCSTSWNGVGSASVSGSKSLPTIPRASTASASNSDIGTTVTINTNRKSNSFTHSLTVTLGQFTKSWSNVGASTTWDTSLDESDLYAEIPNSPDGTVTISCTTYNGGSNLGTKTSTFKLIANETINKPTVVVSAVDTNQTLATGNTIQDITGDTTNKTLIKFISNVAVTVTATAKNSATISSTKATAGDGTYYNGTGSMTATFYNVETDSYTGEATDSRGYNTSVNVTDLTMLDYTKLSISPVRLYKTNQTSDDLYAEIDGNYFKDSFNTTPNVLTLSYKYKETGTGTWSSWVSLTPTISGTENKYTFDGLIGSTFDYKKIYDFVFKVEDLAMVQTIEAQSVPGIPIIGIFEDFVEMWGEVFVYKD